MQARQLIFGMFVKNKDFVQKLSFTTLSEITINTQDVSPALVILYARICNQLIDL